MYKEGGELNHTLSVCLAWLLCRKGTKKLEHYKIRPFFLRISDEFTIWGLYLLISANY